MDLFQEVDDGPSTDSEDDIVVVQAVAVCLKSAMAVFLADRRRAKRPRMEQITFPNTTWQQVYCGEGNGWFRANLRMNRTSFDLIADWIESSAPDFDDLHPGANARVDYRMKLAMTMAYLAQSSGFQATASLFGVSKATAITSINNVMDILQHLAPKVIYVRYTVCLYEMNKLTKIFSCQTRMPNGGQLLTDLRRSVVILKSQARSMAH
jgi:hypothetical protein